ncbi:MAG: Na+/H+ antiporter NhaA [Bacteroidaceae bacterium]|nr:Na+/H+ antiporter NhaA [Bacteroidaceae bacterium]MBQ2185299.1 Na+/H+ antiporter NhaA [Bacteroidaceae bacterium]
MANYAFLSSFKKYVNSSVLLIGATILALLVANLDATRELYKEVWTLPVNLSVGGFNLFSHGDHTMSLGAFINDFLMAIFFLSVGLEIKREFLCGELSSMKKALLPIIGACGGMIVPVIVFFILCGLTSSDPLAERGMAIPMATDIAFSLGVLSMFSRRVPMGLKIFLAALAVTDDLGGIIVIGVKYTDHLSLNYVLGAIACVFLLVYGNLRQTRSKMFYLSIGIALWYCMLNSGIHATMAGVVLAFCIPANLPDGTKFYIERIRNNIRKFPVIEVSSDDRNKPALLNEDDISLLKSVESASDHLISPLQDLEDMLKHPINYFIIPLFAFANAGVDFTGMSIDNLFTGVGLAVFLGLLVGKFAGVFSFSWMSVKLKVVQLPKHTNWLSFASVCMLCGIGFTVSMFMAELSYGPVGRVDLLNNAKLGILCGTVASAMIGSIMLNYSLPKTLEGKDTE